MLVVPAVLEFGVLAAELCAVAIPEVVPPAVPLVKLDVAAVVDTNAKPAPTTSETWVNPQFWVNPR